jgi:hypothetical protein
MSLNNTPLTEVHRDVLNCAQIVISTADLINSFPILAPNGNITNPTYSFASNTDTGLFRTTDGVSVAVDAQVGLVAAGDGNVALGDTPTDYGGGQGVVFFSDAAVTPVGVPNGGTGGILYTEGQELQFLDSTGNVTSITTAGGSDVTAPDTSLANQLATFSSPSGNIITNSNIQFVSNQLLPGDGTSQTPSYAFTSQVNTGMYLSGTDLKFSVAGSNVATFNATAVSFATPLASDFPGSAANPIFAFTSSTSSGVFYGADHVQLSSNGVSGLAVGGNATRNVAVGGIPGSYGTGADGVLFIPTATTDPVGVPNGGSGGVLYATSGGTEVRWLDASGTSVLLGGSVHPVGAVVANSLAVWGNTTGSSLLVGPVITDAGAVHAVQGVTSNPAYSFTASTNAGMSLSSPGTVTFQGIGNEALSVSSSSVTCTLPLRIPTSVGTAPGLSFTSSPSSGIYSNTDGGNRFSVGSANVFTTRDAWNVSVINTTNDYGAGQGVIKFGDATTNPTTAPTDGGFLYIDGDTILFRDTDNLEHTLTSATSIPSIASSTDNGIVVFNGVTGKVVQDNIVTISDTGKIEVQNDYGFSFSSTTNSGLYATSNSLRLESNNVNTIQFNTSDVEVQSGHVLEGADGSVATPGFAFALDPDTGMYLSSPNTLSVAAGGVHAFSTDADANVAFGSDTPDFAGGQGVVYVSDITTQPLTLLSNGGLLYVNGRNLFFYDKDSLTHQLSGTQGLGSSTDNRVVTLAGTLGKDVKESGFSLSDSNQLTGPNGSAATPAYTVGAAVGWWSAGANTVQLGNGVNELSLNSTATVASVQLEIAGASGMRVGGLGGVTDTFSTPTLTRDFDNASGTFVWQQNGTTVFQTSAAKDVDLLSNLAICTGATGDFTLGYDGVAFALGVANAADSLLFSAGGTTLATISSAGVSAPGVSANILACDGGFRFTSDITSGHSFLEIEVNGKNALEGGAGANLKFLGTGAGGTRAVGIRVVHTAPTSSPTSGVYMYVDSSTTFLRIADKYIDVATNGPHAHAVISRTQTVADSTVDLIDTLTDVESNILVVDTGAPGAGTVTGTAATAGWWEISAEASWASNSTGFRRIRVKVGGVVVGDSTENAVSGIETQHQIRLCVPVVASAVVTFEVEQTSGGNLDVDVIGSVVFMG